MRFIGRFASGFELNAFANKLFRRSKPLYAAYFITLFTFSGLVVVLLSNASLVLHPNAAVGVAALLMLLSIHIIFVHVVLFFRVYFWFLCLMFRPVTWLLRGSKDPSVDSSKRNAVRQQRLKR